ncbi:purine catabolism regulator [Kineococcus radiotolerans]|uniref:Purine catabolism regulator n=1 Tax=Kineococcus radiotolerans TaxID=131568 RepID=A0A7W4TPB0_KINRA|nr:PucR family transcriptional regulator [Kineococcus radiotolerans]MBB2902425.1 purine catabolism regulator [Kineococcus radiotolerans]
MLTVADVLALPVLVAGAPRVRAGEDRLDAPVRWVHVSEQADVTGLLGGGELLLSTGLGLTRAGFDADGYVGALVEAGAAGLVVELGEVLPALPAPLLRAARAGGLPLVELHRAIRFVEVTERVHARLLDAQHERLRFAERVHSTFAALGTSGASTREVLEHAAGLLDAPVVLEDLAHRAVDHVPGRSGTVEVLRDWARRSRREGGGGPGGGPEGWTAVAVGRPGERWGRLVLPGRGAGQDAGLVLERAAEVLTVLRLLAAGGPGEVTADRAHGDLVSDLLRARPVDEPALRQRLRALGLPVRGGFAAGAVHTPGGADRPAVAAALRAAGVVGITGVLGPDVVGVLLVGAAERSLVRLAAELPASATLGVTAPGERLSGTGEGFAEARHVAQVAAAAPGRAPGRVHRAADLGVRGLLWRLRDDARVAEFAEGQLAPLLDAPDGGRADLELLAHLLGSGGSMTRLAGLLHLSRPAAYGRVQRLAGRLGRDLDDPETRLALHLALLVRGQGPGGPGAAPPNRDHGE